MSRKKRKRDRRVVGGAPEIAHPNKRQGVFVRALLLQGPHSARSELKAIFDQLLPYEKQRSLVYAWLLDIHDEVASGDVAVAGAARAELQTFILYHVERLLRLANQTKNRETKRWAGMMLASIGVGIWKQDQKLGAVNPAYLQEKTKLAGKSLTAALYPKPIGKIAQRELKKARRYRDRLLLLKGACGKLWKPLAKKQKIPEIYWPTAKLPEFSMKSESLWWRFLWPLISKKISVAKLDSCYKMARKRFPSDSDKTARDHLKLLARLSDNAVLP